MPGRAERLPDTQGLRNEIVLQKGHVVNYGSLITGDIRLSGARPVEIGAAFDAAPYQLRAALGPATAAALYVVSHHTAQSGMIALKDFIHEAHAAGVPVIVDAAAEYDWPGMIAAGADLVLFSAQKAMGGPTAGLIAGRADLVRACAAQRYGVGRPMKAGKEAVIGAIAALQRWSRRDEAAEQAAVLERAEKLVALVQDMPGITASIAPDETGNPLPPGDPRGLAGAGRRRCPCAGPRHRERHAAHHRARSARRSRPVADRRPPAGRGPPRLAGRPHPRCGERASGLARHIAGG